MEEWGQRHGQGQIESEVLHGRRDCEPNGHLRRAPARLGEDAPPGFYRARGRGSR